MPSGRIRPALALAAALVVGLGLWQLRVHAGPQLEAFAGWVAELGAWAPLAFIAVYSLAVIALVPASLLTLAGGALFGVRAGTAWVFIAASLGAFAAFLIARHGARGWVERRMAASPRFVAIDRAVAEQGLRIVFLLRLSPLLPFNLLNYALGLTRVHPADFALACLGMLPATLAYVYLGSLIGDLAGLGHESPVEGSAWLQRGLSALGVAATLGVSAVLARIARQALGSATAATAQHDAE